MILRVVSVAPRLRRVVEGFITALPGMASVFLLMGIIFYIGSVISTQLSSADFLQWFGSLAQSAYSLLQIMTLESWSMGIVRLVMEVYPYAWVFCAFYYGHGLRCGEPVGGFNCEFHAGCAF